MKLRIAGDVSVPGDKSISHRALMLGAAATGESRLRGLLPGEDCQSTASVLRALGVDVPVVPPDGSEIRIRGRGLAAWFEPTATLDCGNSGTTVRLLMGLLAGRPLSAVLTGDDSLRSRPMRRITTPLGRMGAAFRELGEPDRLPVEIRGGALQALHYRSPKASAQIKSAVLFAGISGGVPVAVTEPFQSRDHSERLLRGLGVQVDEAATADGWKVALEPPPTLPPLDLAVPGDFSSAAFLLALALLADEGELRIRNVGINPTRTGLLDAVARMGGFAELHHERDAGGEPVADLVIRPARLRGTEVGEAEIPGMIDEIPILAALAARAEGETLITGAAELRAKESDRISALVGNLRAIGAEAEELPDGLRVGGSDRPLAGSVRTHGDHRIAMAFGVLAALPGNQIRIDAPEVVDVSFPDFWDTLTRVRSGGATPHPAGAVEDRAEPVVVIDGPAGSGKSSTARAVAARLGFRHLDSGAFYRGLTFAALRGGIPPEQWPELTPEALQPLAVYGEPTSDGYLIRVGGEDVTRQIRSPEVDAHVSRMAALPAVRRWLLGALREAGQSGGLVADGRDLGTVVFPDAELKVFLVCAPAERARRRLGDRGNTAPSDLEIQAEAERLQARDAIDSGRAEAPLLRAPDAVLLDTTGLPFEAQVDLITRLARERRTLSSSHDPPRRPD